MPQLIAARRVLRTRFKVCWIEDHPFPVNPDPHLPPAWAPGRWVRWLEREHPAAREQLAALVEDGCSEDELVFYLAKLRYVPDAAVPDKGQYADDLTVLRHAAERFRFYETSGLQYLLYRGRTDLADLTRLAEDFLERFKWVAPFVTGKRHVALDDLRASIVRHVQRTTGTEHDAKVSELIEVALGRREPDGFLRAQRPRQPVTPA
jgi:hypothetical protein